MTPPMRCVLAVAFAFLMTTGPAFGQGCTPQWWDASQSLVPQVNGIIAPYVLRQFDADGSGPLPRQLFVGGSFTFEDGLVLTPGIARWDGFAWTSVGRGLGSGGISFVLAMADYDADGHGPENAVLVAGGLFADAGGVAVRSIAKWDGSVWGPLGTGLPSNQVIYAAESHDPDGDGPSPPFLIAGGSFAALADGTTCHSVVRLQENTWDASMSLPLSIALIDGDGNTGRCYALQSFDPDGSGAALPVLFAMVRPATINPPQTVIRWDGSGWVRTGLDLQPTSGDLSDTSSAFAEWDPDGPGPVSKGLYVADRIGLRRWIESGWELVPNSAGAGPLLATVDSDGAGPEPERLYTAVPNDGGGGGGRRIQRFTGTSWETVGLLRGPPPAGTDGQCQCLIGFDLDGPGPRGGSLFVGGTFGNAGGATCNGLARFGCEENWGACVGDANQDLVVDFEDVTAILEHWGLVGEGYYQDVNGDQSVGSTDIVAVLTSWGQDCSGAARSSVSVASSAVRREVDPASPMGRPEEAWGAGGFAAVTRALARWGEAEAPKSPR